ncbi:hypothetical protein K470DRAFT_105962 [Piedraia hortae CBS 480.64]|uniref:Uncharacterized protein n=1 Tax=Piedraia hortae CBS 480.64 TaxID=1314780 RepID=A0A6A7C811_9PEZI|nr:hypothetical protein K470DRAFT_105962 [Piedraia hortae CBS 480.64]
MTVKVIKNYPGPIRLVPALPVFSAYPRVDFDSPPSSSMLKRVLRAILMSTAKGVNDQLTLGLETVNGARSLRSWTQGLNWKTKIWSPLRCSNGVSASEQHPVTPLGESCHTEGDGSWSG